MYIGMTASICSLMYTCLIYIVYLKKAKLRNDENKIYNFMIFSNICGLILEFLVYLFATIPNVEGSLIPIVIERFYFVYLFSWLYSFTIYIYIISFEDKKYNYDIFENKKIIISLSLLYLIFISLILFLPVKHIIVGNDTYSTGPACYVLYIFAIISILTSIIFVIKNRNRIVSKKKLPIISLITCLIVMLVIRTFIPEALFISTMLAFVTILTYFTIENPDIRMAKDLAYAKEVAEKSNNNTIKVLDDLESKLQSSLSKLETFGYKKTDTKNTLEMEKDLKYIKKYCINFVDKVNGLIDISKITSGNIKINESEYETNNLIEEIENILSKKIIIKKEKLPLTLYGDKDKIKQTILLVYKYLSSKGNIEVKLDYLLAGRFCKLKFYFTTNDIELYNYIYNVKDYKNRDNNYIFYDDKDNIEYDKIMKLLSLIDASTEIKTNKDKSKELIISINQRIKSPYVLVEEQEENKGIKVRYFNLSNKRILLLEDSSKDIREILLLLKPYKVNIDIAKNFNDVKKYLASNKTYDLIFIDDIIYTANKEEYSLEYYKTLSGYDNFKSIIMISNNKENINKYLDNGYIDYILKPINKKNINEILKKYLK